ncbi:Amidase, hydantoinase/carbamoylase family [uncultured delta proteobacterium]|uniref:Amidase, hydantoinase/carbamoylase family n=1 Tax=uncultured delta proteobacterium TaxID=34034 RepID=A0A212K330_9DELT|nr:Amidase, hydantoinase/carbamoylase family [uncultured delta proteobacterium]
MFINKDRLWDTLETHGKIGGTPDGGVCREALTPEDKTGRDLFVTWCREAGLEVAWDEMGTIYATRPGKDNSLLPLAFGSHLDTQPTGGKYDGILGVLGGLEVMRALNDNKAVTDRPLVLIDWTNEEGSRFVPSMMASGIYTGLFKYEDMLKATDANGKVLGDELAASGYKGTEKVGARKFDALLELHIEQGPVLEAKNVEIGIVTGSQGMNWSHVTINGKSSHAGTTPMPYRLDAMGAMARLVQAAHDIANNTPDGCGTVGSITTIPSTYNTIPHTVRFTLDMRHPDEAALQAMLKRFEEAMAAERAKGFTVKREEFGTTPSQAFAPRCVAAVRKATEEAGFSKADIVSGAGHDCVYVNRVCDVGMIFVPCKDGLSHNPKESITKDQAAAGAEVLYRAVMELAKA